jgi:hypothetical protein
VIIADGDEKYTSSELTLFFSGFIISMPSAMVGFDRRNLYKEKKKNKALHFEYLMAALFCFRLRNFGACKG